jgi:hypothetical protein
MNEFHQKNLPSSWLRDLQFWEELLANDNSQGGCSLGLVMLIAYRVTISIGS